VAKCFCLGRKDEISRGFKGKNFGVGCPGGVEAVAHSLRDTLQKHRKSGFALLKIDFKNAFNLLNREAFVRATSKMFPGLERWTWWCYNQPPLLVYDHKREFFSQSGVQQGDPLGPLYFCCGLQSLIDQISELRPVYQKWYMDDGGIVGSPELLLKVWEILKAGGEPLGLVLNPQKCEWSWLDPDCNLESPISNVPITPTDKIQMLGVPLGPESFTDEFVRDSLLGITEGVMSKLMDFEDTQAALFLLRLSFGIVRATHFMRTTPLSLWSKQAEQFDRKICHTIFQCLGLKPVNEAYDQVSVSTKIGGLGIRRIVDHAKGAFTASWFEAQVTTHESWVKPDDADCSADYATQRKASSATDVAIVSKLKARASPRDFQRLSRLDSPHANAWLSARPSCMDGSDCILPPRIFRTAVARLLGQPVFSNSVPCPLCEQTMDLQGDHPLCCKKSGDRITRHNRLRNLVFKLADTGLLSPELEKLGILGVTDTSRRRPGDVSIKNWSLRRGLAIDVAVICPLAASHLHKPEPCESYAKSEKIDRYAPAFENSDYDFAPVVFETSGALNREGETVLKQIIRFASKREGISHSVFAARAWARLSCCIQFAAAQQILNRDYTEPVVADVFV